MQPLAILCAPLNTCAHPSKSCATLRADGRERYEATCVLIRPDELVVWGGTEGQMDARAVLSKAIGVG